MDTKIVRNKNEIKESNVALYLNYALGSPPLELHVSAIQDLLGRNNTVTVYTCNKSVKACTANFSKSFLTCEYCLYRTEVALSDFKESIKIKKIDLSSIAERDIDTQIEESLKLGVMSSVASAVKAQEYNSLSNTWKGYHNKMLDSSYKLYSYFIKEIKDNNYDYIFMFNGRFGEVKPVLEAARTEKVGYGLYEVKKSLHDVVFVNELVHSISGNTRKAIQSYVDDVDSAKKIAESFYSAKMNNKPTGDPIYTKSQESGLLPDCISANTDKKIVAVYPTTDDEYKFIGAEWDGFVPEDQVAEIESLASTLSSDDYIIVVKMHPNQASTAENILQRYLNLQEKYSHVYVEPPLSKKDTYALMRRADFIINFASTIGVEACYARKIVIMIGDTTFTKMNIGYRTESGREAANLILSNRLKPKPIRGAVIWGNYLASYSDGLSAFSRMGNGDYVVNGKPIARNRFMRFVQLPSKLFLELSKPGHSLNLAFLNKSIDTFTNLLSGKWKVK